jgi:hypothetical protein
MEQQKNQYWEQPFAAIQNALSMLQDTGQISSSQRAHAFAEIQNLCTGEIQPDEIAADTGIYEFPVDRDLSFGICQSTLPDGNKAFLFNLTFRDQYVNVDGAFADTEHGFTDIGLLDEPEEDLSWEEER